MESISSPAHFIGALNKALQALVHFDQRYPNDSIVQSILAQLKFLQDWHARGGSFAEEKLSQLTFGMLAGKNIEPEDPKLAFSLYNLAGYIDLGVASETLKVSAKKLYESHKKASAFCLIDEVSDEPFDLRIASDEAQSGAGADVEFLEEPLFADSTLNAFVVLDGAAIPNLLQKFAEYGPEFLCLYLGPIENNLARAAPYLVHLKPKHPFTNWILSRLLESDCGILATSPQDFLKVRKHFRSLIHVVGPDDQLMFFRLYDPRVLNRFLPTCTPAQIQELFGPIKSFFSNDVSQGLLRRFYAVEGILEKEEIF